MHAFILTGNLVFCKTIILDTLNHSLNNLVKI